MPLVGIVMLLTTLYRQVLSVQVELSHFCSASSLFYALAAKVQLHNIYFLVQLKKIFLSKQTRCRDRQCRHVGVEGSIKQYLMHSY